MNRTTSLARRRRAGQRPGLCRNAAVTAAVGAATVELTSAVQPVWLAVGAAAAVSALATVLDRLAEPSGETRDSENSDQEAH